MTQDIDAMVADLLMFRESLNENDKAKLDVWLVNRIAEARARVWLFERESNS